MQPGTPAPQPAGAQAPGTTGAPAIAVPRGKRRRHGRRPRRHLRAGAPRPRRVRAVAALAGALRVRARRRLHDSGMATAEYAIATLAACGFAALLLALLRGGEVKGMLLGIIRKALAGG